MLHARRQQPGLLEVVVVLGSWGVAADSVGTWSHHSIVPGCGCVEVTSATGIKDTSKIT